MMRFIKKLLPALLLVAMIVGSIESGYGINFFPYISFQFTNGGGSPLTGPIQLRVSLWQRYDVKNDDILVSGALNTASEYYGGFQSVFIVPSLDILTIAGQGGLYRLYVPDVPGFPSDLDSTNAYLQVEVMEPPGSPDTSYVLYDFYDDSPEQIVTRLQIFEETSTIDLDPGDGTFSNSFQLDNNDDATTEIELVFGRILNESLSWDISNNYFFLSDALVVDGNVNIQGTTLRLDSDETGNPDQDLEIVAEQGAEADGILRYDDGNDRWELSNAGGSFDEIATFTRINLDDAYNNFATNPSTITVDAAQGQTGGLRFNGSLAGNNTLTVTNSGNGGAELIENTGTGSSLRVNDSAADTTPFIINDAGLVGIGQLVPTVKLHLFDNTSSLATKWIALNDGTNQVSVLTGTQDPKLTATNGGIGSFYLNSSNGLFYIKQDTGTTTNWNKIGLSDNVNNALLGTFGTPGLSNKFVTDSDPRLSATSGAFGEVSMGTRLDYPEINQRLSNNYIYYVRVFLPSDTTVSSFRVYCYTAATGNINFALYSDNAGVPDTRLIQTGTTASSCSADTFWSINLSTSYDVTVAGLYWLALATTEVPKSATYANANDKFIPYRIQSKGTGSSALPVTAAPNAFGNFIYLPYLGAVE